MALSPDERLRRLEQLLEEKERKKEELAEEEKKTEQELEEAKQQFLRELEELRVDEEVRELLARAQAGRGEEREEAVEELSRRGIGAETLLEEEALWEEAATEPQAPAEESTLEEMVAHAPDVDTSGNVFYDLKERLEGDPTLRRLGQDEVYQGFSRAAQRLERGERLSGEEYENLRESVEEFREGFSERMANPYYSEDDPRKAYASRTNEVVESIEENLGLRIGDSYVRNDDGYL